MKSSKTLLLAALISSAAQAITFSPSDFESSASQDSFFKKQDDILDSVNNGWFGILSLDVATAPYSPALSKGMFGIWGGIEKRFFGLLGASLDLGMRMGGSAGESSSDSEQGYVIRFGLPVYAVANKTWALGARAAYDLGFWTAYEKISTTRYGYTSTSFKKTSLSTSGAGGSLFVTFRGAHLECGATKNLSFKTENTAYTAEDLTKWCALGYKLMF